LPDETQDAALPTIKNVVQDVAAQAHVTEKAGNLAKAGKRFFVAVIVVIVFAAAGAGYQYFRSLPPARASIVLPGAAVFPGARVRMPWPPFAAASVDVEGVGSLGGQYTAEERPLASVAKLITALVVLKQHPLSIGENGPTITISPADVASYRVDAAQHQSVVAVAAGERLSELQALEAMLIPSANNVARLLARWSAGSLPAFVADMNAEAASLGLHHTHFVGPAGLNPGTVGSAADMVRLGEAVLANPLLAQIAQMPQVTLPVAGTVYNYDYALGHDGIVGIKTGSTIGAGGNFVFAAHSLVDGRTVTVVGAVLGVTGVQPLADALAAGEALAKAAFAQLRVATVLPKGREVLVIKAKWGARVVAGTYHAVSLFGFPRERVHLSVRRARALASGKVTKLAAGEHLATVVVRAGTQAATVPVLAPGPLPPPSLTWRFERSL
jgi:D-alanyl-D-alanine carboxypeptidase (penicillin-binding protein 5/6)